MVVVVVVVMVERRQVGKSHMQTRLERLERLEGKVFAPAG